jgi:CO/xanthine dehydrogenase Mo-binding subunit
MWTSTSDRAALASAVFAGTGRRLRSLPLQLEA